MKKIFICLLIISIFLLISCQNMPNNPVIDKVESVIENDNTVGDPNYEPSPGIDISIYSIDELENMEKMIFSSNEKELDDYMQGVSGGGRRKKEDFIYFINLVNSIPYVSMLDGNIVWISYSKGNSQSTGKEFEILYITTESMNGDWMRYEYVLSETNVSSRIEEDVLKLENKSLITHPILSKDGNVTIFTETRERESSGTGDIVRWHAVVGGIYTRIVYYTSDTTQANTIEILSNSSIANIKTDIK